MPVATVALSAIFPAAAPTDAATSESLRLSPAASWTWNVAPGGKPCGTATVYVCCVAGSVNCTFEPGVASSGTERVMKLIRARRAARRARQRGAAKLAGVTPRPPPGGLGFELSSLPEVPCGDPSGPTKSQRGGRYMYHRVRVVSYGAFPRAAPCPALLSASALSRDSCR